MLGFELPITLVQAIIMINEEEEEKGKESEEDKQKNVNNVCK